MYNFLLKKSSNHAGSCVFWNILSSGLNSVVSILLLLVVTRINGTSDAGVFSLAFSTAQMMLTIGNYGMRNYQATDIEGKHSFSIYAGSRIVTCLSMTLFTLLFVLTRGYQLEKTLIFMELCLLKVTDAFDDLYGGFFQNKERLDISGKILFLRVAFYCVIFTIVLLFTHNLLLTIGITTICSSLILILMIYGTRTDFVLSPPKFHLRKICSLLAECFPLCLGNFLLIYIGNAPKYAIDTYLSNDMQAYYTYLFMPCFVINLFVSFALQPILVKLSLLWNKKDFHNYLKIIAVIYLTAFAISFLIMIGGRFLGCQVLGLVFGVDLLNYKNILTLLLLGGGFYSLSVISQVVLTIMRHQYSTLWGFGIASIAAAWISPLLVQRYQLLGAAYAYLIATALLFFILLWFVFFYYIKTRRTKLDSEEAL